LAPSTGLLPVHWLQQVTATRDTSMREAIST